MSRVGEDVEKDKAGADGSVQNTQEDQRRNHEGEGNLLVDLIADGAECRRGVVVRTSVGVDDRSDETEDEDFCNCHSPESLGEVFWILHFSDERRDGDLANKRVTDHL